MEKLHSAIGFFDVPTGNYILSIYLSVILWLIRNFDIISVHISQSDCSSFLLFSSLCGAATTWKPYWN